MKKSEMKQIINTAKELGVFHADATIEQLAERIKAKTGNTTTTAAVKDDGFEGFKVPADFKLKPGRPQDPTSKRQAELAEKHEYRLGVYRQSLIEKGMSEEDAMKVDTIPADYVLPKGRPVVPGSKRQQELAKKAGHVSTGEKGRPIDPTSKRQQELLGKEVRRMKAYLGTLGKSQDEINAAVKAAYPDYIEPVKAESTDITVTVEAETIETDVMDAVHIEDEE